MSSKIPSGRDSLFSSLYLKSLKTSRSSRSSRRSPLTLWLSPFNLHLLLSSPRSNVFPLNAFPFPRTCSVSIAFLGSRDSYLHPLVHLKKHNDNNPLKIPQLSIIPSLTVCRPKYLGYFNFCPSSTGVFSSSSRQVIQWKEGIYAFFKEWLTPVCPSHDTQECLTVSSICHRLSTLCLFPVEHWFSWVFVVHFYHLSRLSTIPRSATYLVETSTVQRGRHISIWILRCTIVVINSKKETKGDS